MFELMFIFIPPLRILPFAIFVLSPITETPPILTLSPISTLWEIMESLIWQSFPGLARHSYYPRSSRDFPDPGQGNDARQYRAQ